MATKSILPLILLAVAAPALASPEVPGEVQNGPIALVGATIHPVSSEPIEGGVLLFDQGKIVAVGADIELPEGARRIDLAGKHVYPGLIDAYTRTGLVEISAVRATRDADEAGQINPNVKAEIAVNPDSEMIPVTRSNGVLLNLTAPGGGLISGTSALLILDGWTYEDLTLKAPVGMHLSWVRMRPTVAWWEERSAERQIEDRDNTLRKLRQAFDDARAYLKARQANGGAQERDARWEAMVPVLTRKLPLIIAAEDIDQIQAAVAFADEQQVRMILFGGYDAPLCAELLKKHDIPVIVSSIYRLPIRRSDEYDAPYTLPARLKEAGIKFCISGSGRFGASNVRNLPYHAATAAAYGLDRDDALKAITLWPAEILGVAGRVGSLEKGKDATLIITDGDPLETPTQVEAAYIQGREVDLNDRHKRLWRKYQEKYRRIEGKGGKEIAGE